MVVLMIYRAYCHYVDIGILGGLEDHVIFVGSDRDLVSRVGGSRSEYSGLTIKKRTLI